LPVATAVAAALTAVASGTGGPLASASRDADDDEAQLFIK